MITRKFVSTSSLMLAMFFLPLGYDALFRFLMNMTGSYWTADIIFYCISICFFAVHFAVEGVLQKTFKKLISSFPFTSKAKASTAKRNRT